MKLAGFVRFLGTLLAFLFAGQTSTFEVNSAPTYNSLNNDFPAGGNFLWPTDASETITSTFGEFRSKHFHAGIDISTNSRSGYKVFAARDGFVWRVSVSPIGYGKAIFLKHTDGLITVYAHLKTFNDTINRLVHYEQKRLERYPVDLLLAPPGIPVKQGDIIGYSGGSGVRTPHLHFEIRDENFNPINPQLFDSLKNEDSLRPQLVSFAILPLDNNSSVGGNRKPLIVNRFSGGRGNFRLTRTINVRGRVGLGIDVRDRINGTYHRGGIYRLELYLNDSLSFSVQFDRLQADGAKEVLSYYNLTLLKRRQGRFQQLFLEHNSSLPIYGNQTAGAGIIDVQTMGEGEHRFSIVCEDLHGNRTTLSGILELSDTVTRKPYLAAGKPYDNGSESREDIFSIAPDASGWFSFDNNNLQVVYDSGAVFRHLNVHVQKLREHNTTFYRLLPQDVLLNKGIRIFLRTTDPTKALAFYERTGYRFELRRTTFDSTTGYYSTTLTTTLSDLALLEDIEQPGITRLTITLNKGRPVVRFRVHDELSGIDAKGIKTYIDGDFVIPEIDDRWRVVAVGEPLSRGKHELVIVVQDNIGNRSVIKKSFDVK